MIKGAGIRYPQRTGRLITLLLTLDLSIALLRFANIVKVSV